MIFHRRRAAHAADLNGEDVQGLAKNRKRAREGNPHPCLMARRDECKERVPADRRFFRPVNPRAEDEWRSPAALVFLS
jgi:hypothetical protein